jgi:hypothetical protein
MKKVLLGFMVITLLGLNVNAQPVADNAVIPMGITLSSVLRLNVVSGGNIEFVFASVNDFQNGLAGDMYRTNLTVESSTDWGLSLYASDFSGSAGTFGVGIVDYGIEDNGSTNVIVDADPGPGTKNILSNVGALYAGPGSGDFVQLTNGAFLALQEAGDGNDGVAADNDFFIRWRCGVGPTSVITPNGSGATLINDWVGTGPGRSTTNILITLSAR